MDQAAPQTIRLSQYTPYPFDVEQVDLTFDLAEDGAQVTASLRLVRKHAGPLVLNGEGLELRSFKLDGVAHSNYRAEDDVLVVDGVGDTATVETISFMRPQDNTQLSGLYKSSGNFCTQCEAEGFRRITYYPDRPDVLAKFRVRIEADRARYPVLLSNGNLAEEGDLPEGRHYAIWDDPFPKPAYLFALVAGDLACLEDSFTTRSGRQVALRIFTVPQDSAKCVHAMESLKKAMAWDEQVFGLEYDLDIYNIVAVSDFNMGAMENKSLNIFNTSCVLATPETATDLNFATVESVIAHEYFHNWTGNRVTCRDWFQLSLKEGLTVFRDQQFSADMGSAAVQRIEDVRMLRARQFPEDAGPLAHPVRPESYIEINNFYTATVYEKGAEIIRMMHTLLGEDGFRSGMDRYIADNDGKAATCEDFVSAMEAATGQDLSQFRRWYSQAGTPHVTVRGKHDPGAQTYTLAVDQHTPPTPGQADKEALHIPLKVGLLDSSGAELPLVLEGENTGPTSRVLDIKEGHQAFVFHHIERPPVPSLLRGFSAPVTLDAGHSSAELSFLMARDTDPFARWEAGQTLAVRIILDLVRRYRAGETMALDEAFVEAISAILAGAQADTAFAALAVTLPSPAYLAQQMEIVDVEGIDAAYKFVRRELGLKLEEEWRAHYTNNAASGPYQYSGEEAGRRSLKNIALAYMAHAAAPGATALILNQLDNADNMTDELAALALMAHSDDEQREPALQRFYDKWKHEPLVVDKWFMVQALSERDDTPRQVARLRGHEAFSLKNPNKIRALIGAFTQGNQTRFHDITGAGYKLLADCVLALDPINPQVAARLVGGFDQWRRFDHARSGLMKAEINRVLNNDNVSRDVFEIATKSLGNGK